MDYGELIRQTRRRLDLKQEIVARKAGIKQQYLSDLENNKRKAGKSMLYRLADAMNVPVDVLMPPAPTGGEFFPTIDPLFGRPPGR